MQQIFPELGNYSKCWISEQLQPENGALATPALQHMRVQPESQQLVSSGGKWLLLQYKVCSTCTLPEYFHFLLLYTTTAITVIFNSTAFAR